MAILFNPQALSRFANVNFGKDKSIVNLGADKETLVKNNELGCFLWKPFRSEENEAKNNAVRTELLKALGQAFEINGVTEHGGQTLFSSAFMDRLEEILGPEVFKREDFGLEGGEVASGKPLTQRRITAIVKAACAKSELGYDATAYSAKVDAIADALNNKDQNAPSTIAGRRYVNSMRRTIEFLESDLGGFDAACPDIDDLDKIQSFIVTKIKLAIYPEEITSFLERANALAKPGEDPVEGKRERRAQIKTFLIDMLQTMVKTTVDICLKAIEAGKFDDCMDVVYNASDIEEYLMRDLEEFRRTQLDNEIAENNNEIVENDNGNV